MNGYNVKHDVYKYNDLSDDGSTNDIITKDKTGSGDVDMDWDIIQRDKDQLIKVNNDKNDVITDEEMNDRIDEDSIQAAEESPSIPILNLQVMAIVDAQLFRKFLKRNQRDVRQTHNAIIMYFSSVFAMVNERFQTMTKFGLDIKIKLAAIVIEEREQNVPWLRGHIRRPSYTREAMIDVESVLRDLTKWLQNSSLPNYDHAVAFTGYALVKNSKKIDGLAYMNKICDRQGHSSSIVGENGDFMSVGVVAHEIAHSLGAVHDGQSRDSGNCSADDNYIMAPQHQMNPEKVQNLFSFSHCSSNKILQLIRSHQPQCLYADNHGFPYPYDLDKRPPGQKFSRETQCKLVFGENSTLCFYITPSRSADDKFCGNVWCQNPSNPKMCQTKARLVTLPGTTCGDNKICRLGKCVPKKVNRESELCGGVTEDGVYCHTLLQRQGKQACQFAAVRNVCCKACLGATGQGSLDTVSK
ncbi:metalloprotease mig-17-like [Saccostrea echinata]|uniref:metalloprotease mig-17-like n=1 Tax=Saccostrea echinata TaxID=191078 RepID=UPI002A835D79|nr:metalloprotease mig-17-like [Saccostrea echinata]